MAFVSPGGPTKTYLHTVLDLILSAHYASHGRLAKYICQFVSDHQDQSGYDQSEFAIELDIFARYGFVENDAKVILSVSTQTINIIYMVRNIAFNAGT